MDRRPLSSEMPCGTHAPQCPARPVLPRKQGVLRGTCPNWDPSASLPLLRPHQASVPVPGTSFLSVIAQRALSGDPIPGCPTTLRLSVLHMSAIFIPGGRRKRWPPRSYSRLGNQKDGERRNRHQGWRSENAAQSPHTRGTRARAEADLWAAFWMFLSPSAELSSLSLPPPSFLCVHANGVTPSSPTVANRGGSTILVNV